MNLIEMQTLLNRVKCGRYDCLVQCGCDILTEFATMVRTMSTSEFTLFMDVLCQPGCPVPGGTPKPGGQGAQSAGAACILELEKAVCTERVKVALKLIVWVTSTLQNVIAVPALKAVLMAYNFIASRLIQFCDNPKAGGSEALLTEICKYWPTAKQLVELADSVGSYAIPLSTALRDIETSGLRDILDRCCATQGAATPGQSSPQPMPRPEPGTVNAGGTTIPEPDWGIPRPPVATATPTPGTVTVNGSQFRLTPSGRLAAAPLAGALSAAQSSATTRSSPCAPPGPLAVYQGSLGNGSGCYFDPAQAILNPDCALVQSNVDPEFDGQPCTPNLP